jgi:glycosyltransferase involved in cell wall biosynthesis
MKSIGLISAYKAATGSTSVALSYFDALVGTGRTVRWYQCISGGSDSDYVLGDRQLRGVGFGSARASLMLNAMTSFPRKIRRVPEEVLLLTDPILLGAADRRRPSALIVHDVREFTDHRWNRLSQMCFRHLFRRLPQVSMILADSEVTRQALLADYRGTVPMVVVHPPARIRADADLHRRQSTERMAGSGPIDVLYVAVDRPYKNVGFFIELAAYVGRHTAGSRFRFTLISRLTPAHQARVRELGVSHLTVHDSLADLSPTYAATDVLVFPSLIEGFGLPLVEAMQFGIPIIAHDASTVPEIVGDGGIRMTGLDVEGWSEALLRLSEPSEFARWAARSAERGKQFTADSFVGRLAPVLDRYF